MQQQSASRTLPRAIKPAFNPNQRRHSQEKSTASDGFVTTNSALSPAVRLIPGHSWKDTAPLVFPETNLSSSVTVFPGLDLILKKFFALRDVGTLSTAKNPTFLSTPDISSALAPLNLAVSGVALHDMNMSLYVKYTPPGKHLTRDYSALTFLNHGIKFGIYLSSAKQQAILFGDLSNNILNRFFVYFAHSAGWCENISPCTVHYIEKSNSQLSGVFPYVYHKAYFSQMSFEALLNLRAEEDPFIYLQALQNIFSTFMELRFLSWAKRLLGRALVIVRKYSIRFVPHHKARRMPAFSDGIYERVVCLSQLIYAQLCLNLLDNDNESLTDLENQMEEELPVCVIFRSDKYLADLYSCRLRTLSFSK